jgi:His-Xaa-Ser system radical SAM maturase HxsB
VSKFHPLEVYEEPLAAGYTLLPFNFTRLREDQYVLSNQAGEFLVLDRPNLERFVRHKLDNRSEPYKDLKSKHFLIDHDSRVALDLLPLKLRTKMHRLSEFTGLHIFVVSLRCEHSCPYCQVSRRNDNTTAFDMTQEIADRALAVTFRSPSPAITIEFQGGEPLLNFELIRYITQRAEEINRAEKRQLQFVIATNLALVTDDVLAFCKAHSILISTSLDGPRDLHNSNRPRPGNDSYERTINGIRRARAVLGRDRVSALMTTTSASLGRVKDIIDEYLEQEMDGIFLRPLSPYGFAIKTKSYRAYNADDWLRFYFEGLDYILQINKDGYPFAEHYASLILTKMLTPFSTGYVDLMNPSGIGIGAVVYNYDGDVYASDEGRMLAEMKDKTFCIGNLARDNFEDIFTSDRLLEPLEASFSGSAPMCNDCAFESYCGADPVFHHATQKDFVGHKPTSQFCSRNMAIFKRLIALMQDDPAAKAIFHRWIRV